MKSLFKVFLAFGILLSSGFALADAVDSQLGVGVSVGSDDGVTMLYKYSEENALQGGLSIGDQQKSASLDYLKLYNKSIGNGEGVVVPYVGVGGFYSKESAKEVVKMENENGSVIVKEGRDGEKVGVRIPIGLQINVPKTPMQFAVELAPSLQVEPEVNSYLDSMLGVRVMF